MRELSRLSRRRFLELAGLAASAMALEACTPSTPMPVTATPIPPPPAPTPLPPLVTVTEPSGIEMVLVEAGTFEMGAADGRPNAQPVHTVNITRPFYISTQLVTADQYDLFSAAANRPASDDCGASGGDRPSSMTWEHASEYCNWLSLEAGLEPCYPVDGWATECDFGASGYRLSTEAEWEFAARGGTRSQGYLYAGSNDPDEVSWHDGNSDGVCHPSGQKAPNELGIYDLSGNAWEWCWDWYVRDYYGSSPTDDPHGPDTPPTTGAMVRQKSRRGGFFGSQLTELRVTARAYDDPYRYTGPSIRLVRTA